jgi:hypothetical protein
VTGVGRVGGNPTENLRLLQAFTQAVNAAPLGFGVQQAAFGEAGRLPVTSEAWARRTAPMTLSHLRWEAALAAEKTIAGFRDEGRKFNLMPTLQRLIRRYFEGDPSRAEAVELNHFGAALSTAAKYIAENARPPDSSIAAHVDFARFATAANRNVADTLADEDVAAVLMESASVATHNDFLQALRSTVQNDVARRILENELNEQPELAGPHRLTLRKQTALRMVSSLTDPAHLLPQLAVGHLTANGLDEVSASVALGIVGTTAMHYFEPACDLVDLALVQARNA